MVLISRVLISGFYCNKLRIRKPFFCEGEYFFFVFVFFSKISCHIIGIKFTHFFS